MLQYRLGTLTAVMDAIDKQQEQLCHRLVSNQRLLISDKHGFQFQPSQKIIKFSFPIVWPQTLLDDEKRMSFGT